MRAYLAKQLAHSTLHEHGYRLTMSMKRLHNEYGAERLNAACARALEIGAEKIGSVRSILRYRLDQQVNPDTNHQEAAFDHANVRGADCYH